MKPYKMKKIELRQEEIKLICVQLFSNCKKNSWKTIGISSSRRCEGLYHDIFIKIDQGIGKEIKLVELAPIRTYGSALEEAQQCDAIVLLEQYAYSYYSEFEETVDILKYNDITLAGVVTSY